MKMELDDATSIQLDNETLRTFFINALPASLRPTMSIVTGVTLYELADIVDKMMKMIQHMLQASVSQFDVGKELREQINTLTAAI